MHSLVQEVGYPAHWLLAIKNLTLYKDLCMTVIVIDWRLVTVINSIELGVNSDIIVDSLGKLEFLIRFRFIRFGCKESSLWALLGITFFRSFSTILVLHFDLLSL